MCRQNDGFLLDRKQIIRNRKKFLDRFFIRSGHELVLKRVIMKVNLSICIDKKYGFFHST